MLTLVLAATPDLYQLLAPVDDASHTRSGQVVACLQGTREDVIGAIRQCIKGSDRPICWLRGGAGFGKSAIAQTVARHYAAKGRLLGSFFFLRGAGDRSIIARLIPTLAYQLTFSIPATKPLIQNVLCDPGIFRQSLQHQFGKLIVEPMLSVRNTFLARLARTKCAVMVIDALDECDDKGLMAEFIGAVIGAFQENHRLPFRVVVTSRVEEHIRKELETSAARSVTHLLSLQDFDARTDLDKFFRVHLSAIYEKNYRVMRSVPLPWPSDADVNDLVNKSDGLFVFASTIMSFIRSGRGLPQENLRNALVAGANLDALYEQILSAAAPDHNFMRVISTIVVLRQSLSINSLQDLLRLDADRIVQALLGTQSIILIPEDDVQPIRLIHTSLRDFLTVRSRSGQYFVDPPTHHMFVAAKCLAAMDVQVDQSDVYKGGKEYACVHWCYHLHQGLIGGRDTYLDLLSGASVINCLKDFASQSYHFWVNTLISTGWGKAMDDLKSLISIVEVCDMSQPIYHPGGSNRHYLAITIMSTWPFKAPRQN